MEKEKTLEREEMLSPPDVGKQKKSIDPMVILAIIIVIAAIATWLIPAGSFDRIAVKGADYDKIDMDSFPVCGTEIRWAGSICSCPLQRDCREPATSSSFC